MKLYNNINFVIWSLSANFHGIFFWWHKVASYCRLIFYELACSTRQLFNLVGFSLPKDYFANCRMISEEKEIYLLFKDLESGVILTVTGSNQSCWGDCKQSQTGVSVTPWGQTPWRCLFKGTLTHIHFPRFKIKIYVIYMNTLIKEQYNCLYLLMENKGTKIALVVF